jgi:hypothetical protein
MPFAIDPDAARLGIHKPHLNASVGQVDIHFAVDLLGGVRLGNDFDRQSGSGFKIVAARLVAIRNAYVGLKPHFTAELVACLRIGWTQPAWNRALVHGIHQQNVNAPDDFHLFDFAGRGLKQFSVEKLRLAGLVGQLLKFHEAQK